MSPALLMPHPIPSGSPERELSSSVGRLVLASQRTAGKSLPAVPTRLVASPATTPESLTARANARKPCGPSNVSKRSTRYITPAPAAGARQLAATVPAARPSKPDGLAQACPNTSRRITIPAPSANRIPLRNASVPRMDVQDFTRPPTPTAKAFFHPRAFESIAAPTSVRRQTRRLRSRPPTRALRRVLARRLPQSADRPRNVPLQRLDRRS